MTSATPPARVGRWSPDARRRPETGRAAHLFRRQVMSVGLRVPRNPSRHPGEAQPVLSAHRTAPSAASPTSNRRGRRGGRMPAGNGRRPRGRGRPDNGSDRPAVPQARGVGVDAALRSGSAWRPALRGAPGGLRVGRSCLRVPQGFVVGWLIDELLVW